MKRLLTNEDQQLFHVLSTKASISASVNSSPKGLLSGIFVTATKMFSARFIADTFLDHNYQVQQV